MRQLIKIKILKQVASYSEVVASTSFGINPIEGKFNIKSKCIKTTDPAGRSI